MRRSAGTNITLHKDAAWKESWTNFKEKSKLMQSIFAMKNTYEESENPLISTARSISDRVAGFFAENETALVIKKFRGTCGSIYFRKSSTHTSKAMWTHLNFGSLLLNSKYTPP